MFSGDTRTSAQPPLDGPSLDVLATAAVVADMAEAPPSGLRTWLRGGLGGFGISLCVHGVILGLLGMYHFSAPGSPVPMLLETLFADEERPPEEFTRELDVQTEIAETLNFQQGGVLSQTLGGGAGGGGQQGTSQMAKIDSAGSLQEPAVAVNLGQSGLPGVGGLGEDLGMGNVSGEGGAVVEGYGAALDQFSQELVRMMREQRVLVIWLFDESESMKDDQQDLKGRLHRIYEELKLVDDSDALANKRGKAKGEEILLTSIVSFGEKVHFHLNRKRPTADNREIMKAVDAIPIDRTGVENTCSAIVQVIDEYKAFAGAGQRKIVLACVSDEAGDDGMSPAFEEALNLAKKTRTSIYFFGRESVFGYPYAFVNWVHPQLGTHHWLQIRRGPETPYAEQLQIDGFAVRRDASLSGFGPYEQVRLARDTGGIFFLLPNEEQNLNDITKRKFAALDLKEFEPDLRSRRQYAEERDKSPFRKAVWDVIGLLNPYDPANKDLGVDGGRWFPREAGRYEGAVSEQIARGTRMFMALSAAQERLEAVKGLRAKESSRRWRANYDLILGQVMSYRVRMFQYVMGLEQFGRGLPKRKFDSEKSNQWHVGVGAQQMLKPDPVQLKALKVTEEALDKARKAATDQYETVLKEHPGTPWAVRAEREMRWGYGATFGERFWQQPVPPKISGTPVPVPNL